MEKPEKKYKVTYKTYWNERLKKSSFHTKLMYPLYVQVIFDRVPITFKSYYYDLFSKPKYAIRAAGSVLIPDIKEIIKKEKVIMDFIIEKNIQDFSLDLFKKEYAFYSRDLLDIMEESFLDYLFTFLSDEGMPFIAGAIKEGALNFNLYYLASDLKMALNSPLYKRLIENSFYYAPPYLPLYAFTKEIKQVELTSLTVLEWEHGDLKKRFVDFFKKHYPSKGAEEMLKEIQKWVSQKIQGEK